VIRFHSSWSLGFRLFTLVCVLPSLDWMKAHLPKAMSLMDGEYRKR
jgi:hypothetical protein